MSALNYFQAKDAIHFFADGGFFNNQGQLSQELEKLTSFPRARAVMGMTGREEIVRSAPSLLNDAKSLHDLVRSTEHFINVAFDKLRQYGQTNESTKCVIGGFTDAGERQVWELKRKSSDAKPAQFVRVPESRWSFTPKFCNSIKVDCNVWLSDPDGHGLALLEAQRKIPAIHTDIANGEPFHCVGAFAQSMTVRFDSISTRILKRWPDVVGQRITLQKETVR